MASGLPTPPHHEATQVATTPSANRAEGSFGNAFASLSSETNELPPWFKELKLQLLGNNEDAILASWQRLLEVIASSTIPRIKNLGQKSIPSVEFSAIEDGRLPEYSRAELKAAGVIIVRGIVTERQALGWKADVQAYIGDNPQTRGYPKDDLQIYELYWAKAQLEARSHPNMVTVQKALNEVWHSREQDDPVDLGNPITYCDRLRIRTPGDRSFNLGPHLDGGSLERWEDSEYRKCYSRILEGKWEEHDAFNVSPRLRATMDKYNGPGGCSAFRTYQGWLSLSNCGPTNGTLRVIPDIAISTAYVILRPLVRRTGSGTGWEIDRSSPIFHGAAMGAGQELESESHSHIATDAFVSIPLVHPGDAVFWHCDTAHMVESEHEGTEDASVFYIPSAPLCDVNTRYLKRQKDNFLKGVPPPDFPGGIGESRHVGRDSVDDMSPEGKRAMGFARFRVKALASEGQRIAAMNANAILGL